MSRLFAAALWPLALSIRLTNPSTIATVMPQPCRITIQARNDGPRVVTIRLGESRSRNEGGLWNRWSQESNWTLAPDKLPKSHVVVLSLPCNAGARQYELAMASNGTERVVRFPGDDEYSGATTIALGNIARHF